VLDLHRLAKEAPVEAREALRAIFKDGRIVMHPQADGTYLARTEILPLVLIAPQTRNPARPGRARSYAPVGCAGAISPMYTIVSVTAEVRIAA